MKTRLIRPILPRMRIDEDDAEKLFVVIHSIVQKALYKSPLEDSVIGSVSKETSAENSKS